MPSYRSPPSDYDRNMSEAADLIPESDLAKIRRYCAARVPGRVAHLYRLEIEVRGRAVTILECRPPWSPDIGPEWTRLPVARLRFVASQAAWRLYWHDRNLRWHEDLGIAPSPGVDALWG
jgi:hypothetical protein